MKVVRNLLFFVVAVAMATFYLVGPNNSNAQSSLVTYYVSPTGSDSNTGTSESSPFKTFSHAVNQLQPGNHLVILEGTYNERLNVNTNGTISDYITVKGKEGANVVIDGQGNSNPVNVSGNYINLLNLEVKGSDGTCVDLGGQYINAVDLEVHDCQGHGTYVDGKHVVVERNIIYDTNLDNQAKTASSGWGSALKLRVGAEDIILRNNTVYNNYGEGIAATRAIDVLIEDNYVYDNYAVNIYIDNSYNVVVQRNFATCTGYTEYNYNSGRRPAGIALAEEQYLGWGAQLSNVKVINNLVSYCNYGIVYYGADMMAGGGMEDVLIAHNTIWGAKQTAISVEEETAKTSNTMIANNIFHYDQGGKHAVIPDNNEISLYHNFWVGSAPEGWMNASGEGDVVGEAGLANTPNTSDPESYMLGPNSPAIDAGGSLSPYDSITTDFVRKNRTAPYDNGAIEFGPTPLLPSPTTSSPTPSPSGSGGPVPSPSPDSVCSTSLDINDDGVVNILDYSILVSQFFETGPDQSADFNCDNVVNLLDYSLLVSNFSL